MNAEMELLISRKIASFFEGRSGVTMLDAGCGADLHLEIGGLSKRTGIDISQDQLAQNTCLDEKILGDIQSYSLPTKAFDVVVCWQVLEHLDRPEQALLNMFQSLKPDGLLVLGFPNVLSFKGLVTKFTPLWFHRFVYWYMGYSFRPFKTYLRLKILPQRLIRFGQENGFQVFMYEAIEGGVTRAIRNRFLPVRVGFGICNRLLSIFRKKETPDLYKDDCVLILRNCAAARQLQEIVPSL